ncbi:MAG: cupredoxin domain-containing protein [Gemmatimonadales bacterium]
MVSKTKGIGLQGALLAVAALAACGGSDGDDLGSGPDPAALEAARAEPSGNDQAGTAGQDVANPLRIVIVRGGIPEAGAVVTWSATGTGASMTPEVDTTGPDGISTSLWHLGSEVGTQTSQALVEGGAEGSPVSFTATAAAPGGGANEVGIQLLNSGGNRFEPANVTIPVGTKVTWTWVGGFHDVTATGNPAFPSSGAPVSPPNSFSHTFNSPGTYLYFCSVHGSPTEGMRGTIVVQ